jgi:hypothetical protein
MAGLRDWLTGDGGRTTREWLEFTDERSHRHLRVVTSLTVPSAAMLSRYWSFVPHEARAELARRAAADRQRDPRRRKRRLRGLPDRSGQNNREPDPELTPQ